MAIDLFAGAGGLSLGLEQAGFDVVAAVEIDPIHCCVHQYNFPQCAILPNPIETLRGDLLREVANLSPTDTIDLVAGGPPCQGFSLMGQRALDDPRNHLVKEYIRLVDELQPSYTLFENVKGLTIGKHQHVLNEIIHSLEVLGYHIVHPWRILNAKDYGVPQSRERLFVLGAKVGHPLPQYPSLGLPPVTCEEALGDLPDAEHYEDLRHTDAVHFEYLREASGYSALMRCTHAEAWQLGYRRRWDSHRLTSSLLTNHTAISRQRFQDTPPGTVEPISRFFKLAPDGLSNTLRAGTDSARGAFTSPRPIHYRYPRCVTVREMARLHGFPDWFRFHGTKWHGARQIGNAVPPPLAYALGREVINAMALRVDRPQTILDLGDDHLLRVDPTAAAHYWGIENPIQSRNRKRSEKNRKSSDAESRRVTPIS